MLYTIARVMQFAGLVLLPIAMAGQVEGSLSVRGMLTVAGVGIGVFIAGWLLQQMTRPK